MSQTAHTLNCLMCGAPTRSDKSNCEHCGARLATMACPSCFGMIFQGSQFCPLCGARADRQVVQGTPLPCPRCEKTELTRVRIGKVILCECGKCEGFWVDKFSFEQICTDREQQSAVLGPAVQIPLTQKLEKVRYVKCPECQELMQRVNFASSSGVVIDMCREHGSWFDAKELQRIIEFIRKGGLERAREKQISELEEARRRAAAERVAAASDRGGSIDYHYGPRSAAFDAVAAVGSLLGRFLRD